MGTAVVRHEHPTPPPRPLLVVDLKDPASADEELSLDSGSDFADDSDSELESDDDPDSD